MVAISEGRNFQLVNLFSNNFRHKPNKLAKEDFKNKLVRKVDREKEMCLYLGNC